MAESQQNTDWDAVRLMALQCLSEAWNLVSWAERSQEDDYDVERAALHLEAIDSAVDTLRRAGRMFTGGVKVLGRDSMCGSALFEAISLASAGEKARPVFQVGVTCCATAHQNAYLLLRMVLFEVESALLDDAVAEYFDHLDALSPDTPRGLCFILHTLSPEALRELLIDLERIAQIARFPIGQSSVDMLETWIKREWAAVSRYWTDEGKVDPVRTQEIADAFRVNNSTVHRWFEGISPISKQKLPESFRVGTRKYYDYPVVHPVLLTKKLDRDVPNTADGIRDLAKQRQGSHGKT